MAKVTRVSALCHITLRLLNPQLHLMKTHRNHKPHRGAERMDMASLKSFPSQEGSLLTEDFVVCHEPILLEGQKMIRHIKLLRNIGMFESDAAAAFLILKRLVLVYGENGRGKTTLAAILRSVATGKALPVNERQRFGSTHPPHIVLDCHGHPSNVMFKDGAWNRVLPNVKIFDDVFVDENVYSGLAVDSSHRQHLHELILGDQGVALNRALQELVDRINQHNTALAEKSNAIPEQARGNLSVDDFCALSKVPEIETRIEKVERALMAARNQDTIQNTPEFEAIRLPELDIEAIRKLLSTDLPELDTRAEAKVQMHVQTLGEGGESWIAEGMKRVAQVDDGDCPFCGQDVTGLDLVGHYRAYFDESYTQLKSDVADLIKVIEITHAEGTQVTFERAVATARESSLFWAEYCDVPPIEIDTEAIVQAWTTLRETVAEQLRAKQAAPLERQNISERALDAVGIYNAYRNEIRGLNGALATSNDAIIQVRRQAQAANTEEILSELATLKVTRGRFSSEIAPLCADYLQETKCKAVTEARRAEARNAIEAYRANVFPKLQDSVNSYLQRFNAGFRVGSLVPTNIGGGSGSTCTYNVIINNTPVAVRRANVTPGEPSFRNSMSAGDRNTLALALFFSTLDQNPNLADSIVVIDDPMSSLDDHRSLTTVQEVRKLAERARQVIVLSHNKRFLCRIWNGADRNECASLEIAQDGDESTILCWNVSEDAITEHDQRYILLQKFASTGSPATREVAQAIRLHLEGFLRVACPGHFSPGQLLGPFIRTCSERFGQPDQVLDETKTRELGEIVEYANRFHHDTNAAWESETINSIELLGFVKRTLAFAGLPR